MTQPKRTQSNKENKESKDKNPNKKVNPNSSEADQLVMDTLFHMATQEKNTTVLMFWAKARLGMSDKGSTKDRNIDQVPTIILRTEEKAA